ncbi:uncharacterized protein LOC119689488 [Teleopsis dalmanni]|uniref:uncharacterized protein LOC119689488 n=1 Tax=Teleopsis dalmanni TaxID=139649 RepID=UPI0018CD277A|nr:uncharacterized protein LOC119689488 [Teleopsis dalmanni]
MLRQRDIAAMTLLDITSRFVNTNLGQMLYATNNVVPIGRQIIVISAATEPNLYEVRFFDKLYVEEIISRTTCDLTSIYLLQRMPEYTVIESIFVNNYITDQVALNLALATATNIETALANDLQIIPSDDETIEPISPTQSKDNEMMARNIDDDAEHSAEPHMETGQVDNTLLEDEYNLLMDDAVNMNDNRAHVVLEEEASGQVEDVQEQFKLITVDADSFIKLEHARRAFELWKELIANGHTLSELDDTDISDDETLIVHYEKLLAKGNQANCNTKESNLSLEVGTSQETLTHNDADIAEIVDGVNEHTAVLDVLVDEKEDDVGLTYDFLNSNDEEDSDDELSRIQVKFH